jgi:hypothetical protein
MRTFLITSLLAISAFARDHSVLNGTWTLEPAQSSFNGQPAMQTGNVTISDRDGAIAISRDFQYEGVARTYFYKDSLGNEENSTIHASPDLKTKTKWEHDVLTVTTTQPGSVTVETYRLAPDGSMTVDVSTSGRQPITLHFKRQ